MNERPTQGTLAGRTYLALQRKARDDGRSTDELLRLAVLEAFVDRLATSARSDDLVLKGGVLLAAYDVRRPTRDVDLAARNIANDPSTVAGIVQGIGPLTILRLSGQHGSCRGVPTLAHLARPGTPYPHREPNLLPAVHTWTAHAPTRA